MKPNKCGSRELTPFLRTASRLFAKIKLLSLATTAKGGPAAAHPVSPATSNKGGAQLVPSCTI